MQPTHTLGGKIYKTTLETSGEDGKTHSKRVEKMEKNTLEMSGEDLKTHSKRVCFSFKYDDKIRGYDPLVTFEEILQLARLEKADMVVSSTRFECSFFHFSTRFECSFFNFPTRFECSFFIFPLVSCVFFLIFILFSCFVFVSYVVSFVLHSNS